jgi:hypothetical protein
MLRVDNPRWRPSCTCGHWTPAGLRAEIKAAAEAAQQSVAIQERISKEDQQLERQLIEAIQNGGNIAEFSQAKGVTAWRDGSLVFDTKWIPPGCKRPRRR